MIQGIVGIAIGVMALLIGLGKARVSTNPEANAAFVKRWGKFFTIGGPIIALVGLLMLLGAI
jgi:hypothetical protein